MGAIRCYCCGSCPQLLTVLVHVRALQELLAAAAELTGRAGHPLNAAI